MKLVKPMSLGFLSRPFEARGTPRLGISVFAFVPLAGPPRLYTEQDLWRLVPRVLGEQPILDEGIPKSRAELLVAGRAFPPDRPATTCPVEVELGPIRKELHVVGDRFWRDDVPTEPEPFEAIDLSWDNAFGGEGFELNPRGKGVAPVRQADGTYVHALPNVEHPGRLIRSKKDRPAPGGLRALDPTSPVRAQHRGTYDEKWLEEQFPGPPLDEDWRTWNLAPEDQRIETPFAGDEPFRIVNMHREHPVLEGSLPGLRARCFAVSGEVRRIDNRKRPPGSLREVALRLMTVWLFPEHDRGVLVFSGSLEVREDDARDVSLLVLAAERLGQERPVEHYEAVVDRRYDAEWGALNALFDDDLVPGDLIAGVPMHHPELRSQWLLRKNAQRGAERQHERAAATAAQHDLTLDELGIEAPPRVDEDVPPLREIPHRVRQMRETLEQQVREARERAAESLAEAERLCEAHGVDFEAIRRSMEAPHTGPPTFRAEAHREFLREQAADAAAMGSPMPWLEEEAEDEAKLAEWKEREKRLLDMYREGAHLSAPAPARSAQDSQPARERVLSAVARGESLEGADLTGADLSGVDLRGARLAGALMESVRLNGTTLDGADLRGAVLAHADLTDASLRGANLRDANLGRATLRGATTDAGTDLGGAILYEARGDGARLIGASLEDSVCLRARLREADLSGARLARAQLVEADLSGACLAGADLRAVAFVEMDLRGVSFADAVAPEATFLTCKLDGAIFARADLTNARFVAYCSLERADFRHARLDQSNLRGAALAGADFSGAALNGADLGEADLEGAKLYRIVARHSRWVRADLRKAAMMGADLLRASLSRADLRGTDLRGSNLFEVDFSRVRGDDETLFDQADRTRIQVHPRRRA